ncbi:MAG: NAD+ synthase [Balneolaceae bacterium]
MHNKQMKIRTEQLNPLVGDLSGNRRLILESLDRAESGEVDLLVLPEMVTAGYPPMDLLERRAFVEELQSVNRDIVSRSGKTALLFGTVTRNRTGVGRSIFNSAILARGGKELGRTHKTLLPTYDVFDDLRYFEPGTESRCLVLDDVRLGVTICEDLWYNHNEIQYHYYDSDPASLLKADGARILINISASPFTRSKHENRLSMLRHHASTLSLPLVYSNQVGANTELIFDGDSLALDDKGDPVALVPPFEPGYADLVWEVESGSIRTDGNEGAELKTARTKGPLERGGDIRLSRVFRAICLGLRDYLAKSGAADRVIVGLSGGIDSAIIAALAVESLGADRVSGVTMPGEFSSRGSVKDSETLAENLGIMLEHLPINELYTSALGCLKPLFGDLPFGVAEENLQSRIRGMLLMALSNKRGPLLLTTGNKSEMATGYATLYGDMNGGLNLIGDLYKSEVYALAWWLNEVHYGRPVIPVSTLEKPPSAELRPDQKDSDALPDYSVLDRILYRSIELQQGRNEIVEAGFDRELVEWTLRRVEMNEFKRFQAPPVLKLTSKAFGTGRRHPLVRFVGGEGDHTE